MTWQTRQKRKRTNKLKKLEQERKLKTFEKLIKTHGMFKAIEYWKAEYEKTYKEAFNGTAPTDSNR
jgi:hypothetical protein